VVEKVGKSGWGVDRYEILLRTDCLLDF